MKNTPANMAKVFAKRATLLDEQAARADIRRARALKLGNQREADGAKRTAEDARHSARLYRAKIEQ
ncbi:MAG: hypothetical protein KJ626_11110 [Verrucomicrobia bacterium]|nr:hypothetical protein [Verrucomicrobiota bacterium]